MSRATRICHLCGETFQATASQLARYAPCLACRKIYLALPHVVATKKRLGRIAYLKAKEAKV